jgi:integrase/recombinase XerD
MLTTGNQDHRMSNDYLEEHLTHLKAERISPHTIESRRSVCRQLNNWLPFGLIYAATEQIEAWLADLVDRGLSPFTSSVYVYHVKAFFAWVCEAGKLDGNPAATIRQPRAPQCIPNPITEDELSRALTLLPDRIRTAFILAAFAGLRVSEIAACRRKHLTPETLLVPCGKGGNPGVVPMHPYVWAELSDRPDGLLIVDDWGQQVTGHWITVHARKQLDKIGLHGVRCHRARHRYGTLIQEMQGDIRVTQKCLRHTRVTSTEGYTLVSDAKRVAAVALLPVPGGKSEPALLSRPSLTMCTRCA